MDSPFEWFELHDVPGAMDHLEHRRDMGGRESRRFQRRWQERHHRPGFGNRQWWVALSNGSGFTNSRWDTWSTSVTWVDVQVGDFNGDGKSDITGRALQSGQWWTGLSNGSTFNTSLWATWSTAVSWTGVRTGDFA